MGGLRLERRPVSVYPTPYLVDVYHFLVGQVDEYGNDVEAFSAPQRQRVIGWSPRGAGNSRNSQEFYRTATNDH